MTRSTQHRHVVTDDEILSGEPIINGTRTPVRAIVEMWRSGLPPEEIPPHSEGWTHYLGRLVIAAAGGDPGPDPRLART